MAAASVAGQATSAAGTLTDEGWRDAAAVAPLRSKGQLCAPPAYDIKLEHVHGYRSHDARANLRYAHSGQAIFPAAGVGVVYDSDTHSQMHRVLLSAEQSFAVL